MMLVNKEFYMNILLMQICSSDMLLHFDSLSYALWFGCFEMTLMTVQNCCTHKVLICCIRLIAKCMKYVSMRFSFFVT